MGSRLKNTHTGPDNKQIGTVLLSVGEYGFTQAQIGAVNGALEVCDLVGIRPHVVFTGGVNDPERIELGEIPAFMMQIQLMKNARESHFKEILRQGTVDQFSQNTGHQAWVVGGVIKAALRTGPVSVIVSVGRSHVPRYTATIATAIIRDKISHADMVKRGGLTFVGFGNNEWDDKAYGDVTHREAAFRMASDATTDHEKKRYGQLTDRFRTEFDWEERGYACGTTPAPTMLSTFNFI